MSYWRFFLGVSIIILTHTAALVCFFRDEIVQLGLLSSATSTISHRVVGKTDQHVKMEDLEKMWEEQVIEDLFKGTAAAPKIFARMGEDEVEELGKMETAELSSLSETISSTEASGITEKHDKFAATENFVDDLTKVDTSQRNPHGRPERSDSEDKLRSNTKTPENIDSGERSTGQGLKSKSTKNPPKMVLVLTQSRHGSTWLMDMLGYGDKAVPVFEPLNSIPFLKMYAQSDATRKQTMAEGYDPVKYGDWKEVLLTRICTCDWYGDMIPGKSDTRYGTIMGLWYKDMRLHQNETRPFRDAIAIDTCTKEGSMMVPKTIRYYNMSDLYKVRDLGCDDFKVVHLVRDPRAVMNSRMMVFHELYDGTGLLGMTMTNRNMGQLGFDEFYMSKAADFMCSHHLYNYELGMNPPTWLEGRYKMVRYEDLAESPQILAKELLDFIGVKYTHKYQEYVYNITHVRDRGKEEEGSFGVEKQSREVMDNWKHTLIEPHWITIEKACADMMKVFDYRLTFPNSDD